MQPASRSQPYSATLSKACHRASRTLRGYCIGPCQDFRHTDTRFKIHLVVSLALMAIGTAAVWCMPSSVPSFLGALITKPVIYLGGMLLATRCLARGIHYMHVADERRKWMITLVTALALFVLSFTSGFFLPNHIAGITTAVTAIAIGLTSVAMTKVLQDYLQKHLPRATQYIFGLLGDHLPTDITNLTGK